ncbi:hypothetical protein LY78DRAFT_199121 [Colletotrichum sublineola]|nr:hypothetical protein LY78DRAFT_199121 [Colletotrichum sublineola]
MREVKEAKKSHRRLLTGLVSYRNPTWSRVSCLCNSFPQQAFPILPSVPFETAGYLVCFAAMIARRDPDLIAQFINPPTWNVAKSVEKEEAAHPGTWYLKINNANGAAANHACACACMLCGLSPMPPVSQRPTWRQVSKFRLKSESNRVCC